MTVVEAIVDHAIEAPEDVCIVVDERSITWRELTFDGAAVGSELLRTLPENGRRVGIRIDDPLQFLYAVTATLFANRSVVPLPPFTSPTVVEALVERLCLDTLIVDEANHASIGLGDRVEPRLLRQIYAAARHPGRVQSVTPCVEVSDSVRSSETTVLCDVDVRGEFSATSNTHDAQCSTAEIFMRQLGIDASSCVLITAPLFAPRAFSLLMTTLYAGGRSVLAPSAPPQFVARLIEHEPVTVADVRPAMLRSIAANDVWISAFPAGCLLAVAAHRTNGSRHTRRLFGKPFAFVCSYGLKETGPVSLLPSGAAAEKWGSAGLPDPAVVVRSLPLDDEGFGEIVIQSPAMMSARIGDRSGAPTWYEDAQGRFCRTGVLGRIDGDGYLWLRGRSDR